MTARTPAEVELLTAGPPQRPYAEVAVFEATQYGGESAADMLAKLRASAADSGCDAVVVGPHDTEARQHLWRGTCVVYRQDEASSRP